MFKGIDVSHWQGGIQWTKVKAAGNVFAIIKATEGTNQVDSCFVANAQGAANAGLHIGAYHFLRAGDVQAQAEHFISTIKPYPLNYPAACDVEAEELLSLGKDKLTDMVIAFCEAVRVAGYYPAVYSNLNWVKNHLDMSRLNAYDLWFARYSSTPGYDGASIWQYNNAGHVDGITGDVDLDLSYKDYPAISNLLNSGVKIDTTMDVTRLHGQYYVIKTTSASSVTVTAGTNNVVTIVPFPRAGTDQLYALVAVGQSGQETGIFTNQCGEKPLKRFVFKIQ